MGNAHTTRSLLGGLCLCLFGVSSAAGQAFVNAGVVWESYTLDGDLPVTEITELSVPLSFAAELGRWANLTVAAAVIQASVLEQEAGSEIERSISGLSDTEVRLSINLLRDRLTLLTIGTIPTGQTAFEDEDGVVASVLFTEALGFRTRRIGSGGGIGGGLAGALPLGRMALGYGGTYTQFGSFEQVAGIGELSPGGELRLRAGIEGPAGPRTYLRLAGIYSRTGATTLPGDLSELEAGTRFAGYASLEQGIGNASLSLFALDLYRANEQIDPDLAALLPKSNLIVAGVQLGLPLGGRARLAPRAEFRKSTRAIESDSLDDFGRTFRFGADLTVDLGSRAQLVLRGDGLIGTLQGLDGFQELGSADATGYRFAVQIGNRR
jgi:hypothetical protein